MKVKIIVLLYWIFCSLSISLAGESVVISGEDNNWSEQIKQYKEETKRLDNSIRRIYNVLEVYELKIVENEYKEVTTLIDELTQILEGLDGSEGTSVKNKFYNLYEATLDSYDDLVELYEFYVQLENKKEDWSDQYFNLWEQAYSLKTRIERNYVKEEKMNVNYGALSDHKVHSVYKRNIYEACSTYFESNLAILKRTGDCDHYERIQILEKMIPVLQKCDKLAYYDETRDLEKDLRRVEDPVKIRESILEFEITAGE